MATKAIPVTAAKVASTQTDYPAYIKPSAMTGWGALTTAEANSIRFYSDSGLTTELAREVVSADEFHVKIPSLTTTTIIYADYDGVRADYAVTDTYGRNAVWSDYRAVHHFDDLTTDYTGNGYTLTNNNSVGTATGKLGGNAADFGATNTNKRLASSSNLGLSGDHNVSITVWFNLTTLPTSGQNQTIVSKLTNDGVNDSNQVVCYQNSSGTLRKFDRRLGAVNSFLFDNRTLSTGTWYHAASVYNGSTFTMFHNGASVQSGSTSGTVSIFSANRWIVGMNNDGTEDPFKGLIDEVRVTTQARSANWITTEYNNQSDVATFWGTVTDVGGVVADNSGYLVWL